MRYPGGKGASGVVQTIINQIPSHRVYIEPFAGGAAVFRAIRPAERSILIEKDRSQAELLRVAFAGSCEVINGCGIAQLEMMTVDSRVFVYCDPPYLPEVRVKQGIYNHEMTRLDHIRLLATLSRLPCRVAISGYASSLYDRELTGWRKIEFPAMTRGGVKIETLWMNYPEPVDLHDYSYVGRTKTERQRIKRKIDRWRSKLAALPAVERNAIMAALADGGANRGSQ